MALKIHSEGFTLIELMVAITIMGVLMGATVVRYATYNDKQLVKQAALTLKSDLQMARTNAISGNKPIVCNAAPGGVLEVFLGYQVSFTVSSYTITPKCSVTVSPVSENILVSLPEGITFSPIPSPASYIYLPLTKGITAAPSQVILTNGTDSVTLTIDPISGSISN